jgi:hypothetical protein
MTGKAFSVESTIKGKETEGSELSKQKIHSLGNRYRHHHDCQKTKAEHSHCSTEHQYDSISMKRTENVQSYPI